MTSLKEFMLILTKLVSNNRQIKRCFRKLLQHKQNHKRYWMKRLLHEIVKNKPSRRTKYLVSLFKRFKKAFEQKDKKLKLQKRNVHTWKDKYEAIKKDLNERDLVIHKLEQTNTELTEELKMAQRKQISNAIKVRIYPA
jgi:hypothetical protein